jgi:thermostable 8-oxoguanine DNA glycosylase
MEHKNEEWFEENLKNMNFSVENKRAEYLVHVNNSCPASKNALRTVRGQC